jgi:hypothetical protein
MLLESRSLSCDLLCLDLDEAASIFYKGGRYQGLTVHCLTDLRSFSRLFLISSTNGQPASHRMSGPLALPTQAKSDTAGLPLKVSAVVLVGSVGIWNSVALSTIDNGCKHRPRRSPGYLRLSFQTQSQTRGHDRYEHFTKDIMRLSGGRSDPALVKTPVGDPHDTIAWRSKRVTVPFILSSYRQDGPCDCGWGEKTHSSPPPGSGFTLGRLILCRPNGGFLD